MGNYLYNGVELRDIYTVYTPELQKTHPYVFIYRILYNVTMVIASTPFVAELKENAGYVSGRIFPLEGSVPTLISSIQSNAIETGWSEFEDGKLCTPDDGYDFKKTFWANYNVLDRDGNILLAASDPIPVPQLNHAALMQGFSTMLSLKK